MLRAIRVQVNAHECKRFVIVLKYEGQSEYRYLVASNLSWRGQDIANAYTLRWLVEVFVRTLKPTLTSLQCPNNKAKIVRRNL